MPTSSSAYVTLCYDNYPDQREFVFSMKGRPFSMLSSQKLSVPSTSLIDFNLVHELGLKMTDLQCSKFSFGGQKFRILGKISQTVQTITNGVISGTVHMRASVVEGLRSVFDSHSIAGKKFSEMLLKKISDADPPASPTPSPPPSTGPSKVSGQSSPGKASAVSSTCSTPSRANPSSPPGFPSAPQYNRPDVTCTEPSVAMDRPPPGHVRTLQLKPDENRYRSWHQGRVIEIDRQINRPDLACVDVLQPCGTYNFVGSDFCQYPGLKVEVNDVVLFCKYESPPDLSSRIYVVYSKEEVDQLKARGVEIPDCPPEMLPGGYYG